MTKSLFTCKCVSDPVSNFMVFSVNLDTLWVEGNCFILRKSFSILITSYLSVCAGPDPPSVVIHSSCPSTAGETHSLTCDVALAQDFRESPVLEWVWPEGSIEDGTVEGVTLSSSSPSTTMTLTFDPLRTSHGGVYWCRASVVDPEATLSISANSSYTLTAQSK